jgi:hypothetical protein
MTSVNSGSDWSSISEDDNDDFVKVLEAGPEPSTGHQSGYLQDNQSDRKNTADLQASSIVGNVEPLYE